MASSTNSTPADDQTEPPSIGIKRVETAQDSKAQRLLRVDQISIRKDSIGSMLAATEVDIKSVLLKEVLLEIFDGVEGLSLNKTPPMCSPEILFHAKDALTSRKADEKEKDDPNQILINDIGTALRFINEDFGPQIQSLDSLLNNGEITFDLLWALMKPKDFVVSMQFRLTGQSQALSVVSGTYLRRQNSTNYFKLNGRMISHDGEDFGYGFVDTEIDEFDGARKITSLTAYPIQYDPNPDILRFLSRLRGRVMADPEAWKFNNGWTDLASPIIQREHSITGKDLDLRDDHLLICANWINGFSLTHKSWGQFSVDGLEDIVWNEDAFKKLVIDETRRKLIHALVRAHRQDDASFDDIIENKGKGLVGLLSGSPGVGKTLTAEAVAEVTSRPLYQVSTGELGIDADKVDKRLGMILEITRRWGCVLLIDEADVFLATRGIDLARDTLVSIFLRRLEYFRGVLILTTNRKSEIDSAFQSRIHFSIHYPDLTESGRVIVWTNFIDTVSKQTGTPSLDSADIEKLARLELNGRQIKNAVSCAVSLAREEKEPLSVNHIEMILSITNL
ncbi:putative aaa family atpase protein [Botrytis fragariae]|uniref:Putative aaa family atpase protein n=1 Tax=Botrytis fragariae TaxID=1964551 RepID=A0A8H6B476_9HELO|nr:putative aaa family atpase protein [Botrytis fragariae]KAF5879131.1 putative aaa family atpase protein [Botrytis fragariae]